jgi:nitrate/TMAO reductase-like tetraheme cytochrome c subunit
MSGSERPGGETPREAPPRPQPRDRRGRPWWVTALALIGAFALVVIVVAIPVRLTSTSSYCTSCHAMKQAGATWSRSAHADVQCVQCHIDPGLGHAIVWRVQEAKNIWASYLDAGKGMAASVHRPSNAACLKCHPMKRLPSVTGDVKIPHATHISMRNLTCADCHSTVSHTQPGQSSTVSMAVCTMCHNGREAPDACTTCHVKAPPTDVHPPNFIATHGQQVQGREADCLRCHHDKAAFCDACHAKAPPSHFAGDWRYSHGAQANADKAACLGCHDVQTFCQQCHQVDHPSDWPTAHAAVAAQGTASCLVCHPRAMCDRCHAAKGVSP